MSKLDILYISRYTSPQYCVILTKLDSDYTILNSPQNFMWDSKFRIQYSYSIINNLFRTSFFERKKYENKLIFRLEWYTLKAGNIHGFSSFGYCLWIQNKDEQIKQQQFSKNLANSNINAIFVFTNEFKKNIHVSAKTMAILLPVLNQKFTQLRGRYEWVENIAPKIIRNKYNYIFLVNFVLF